MSGYFDGKYEDMAHLKEKSPTFLIWDGEDMAGIVWKEARNDYDAHGVVHVEWEPTNETLEMFGYGEGA